MANSSLLDVNARTWSFHSIGVPARVDFSTCCTQISLVER